MLISNLLKYISRSTVKDHLFWICLFLFTDPGGLIRANAEKEYFVRFFFFLIITFLFFYTSGGKECLRNKNIKWISIAILFWALYFILVYGLMNNNATNFMTFLKRGLTIPFTAFCLFFYSYFFAVRNISLFIKYLLFFSFIVFILFFITYFTRVDLLPLRIANRGYVEQERIILYGYSMMTMTIYLAVNILFFEIKIREKRWLILAGGIMIVLWIIAISRRQIAEIFAYILITYLFSIKLKFFRQIIPRKLIIFLAIPLLILIFLFPRYLGSTRQSIVESYSVLTEGQTTSGQKDTRLSLTGQKFVIGKFLENPVFGTGYDPLWFSSEGDRTGYEASDYIFFRSIGTTWNIGIINFPPDLYFSVYYCILRI